VHDVSSLRSHEVRSRKGKIDGTALSGVDIVVHLIV